MPFRLLWKKGDLMRPEIIRIKAFLFFIVLSLCSTNLTIARATGNYHEQLSKGISQLKQNNIDRALAFFEEALAERPEGVEGHYYLGVSHARAKNTKKAETGFKKALSIDRTYLAAHFDLGVLYYQNGEDTKALKSFEIVERIDPNRARVYYYQGIILRRSGKTEEAAEKLKKAISLNPKLEIEVRFQEAASLYESGNFDSARQSFEGIVTLSPTGKMAEASQEFIKQMKSTSENKKLWRLNASFGVQYDDNAILEPSEGGSVKKKSDLIALVFFSGTYRFLKKNRWEGNVTYSLFQNLHLDSDLDDFNIQDHHLTLMATHSAGKKTLILKYDRQLATLGGNTFLSRDTFGPLFKIRYSKQHLTEMELIFGSSNFKNSVPLFPNNSERNVTTGLARFTHFTFLKNNRFFYGEYALEKESAGRSVADDDWSFEGHRLKAGFVTPARYSTVLSVEAQIRLRRFDNINQRSSGKRKDDGLVILLMASKPIRKNTELAVQYLYYRNDSNIPVFSYQRNVLGIIMTANF